MTCFGAFSKKSSHPTSSEQCLCVDCAFQNSLSYKSVNRSGFTTPATTGTNDIVWKEKNAYGSTTFILTVLAQYCRPHKFCAAAVCCSNT